ncbi:unnamed protein product, partial [Mesorhabditis spiculigera]
MSDRGAALINRFSSNQEQRVALQQALYNAGMIIILGVVVASLVALYNMLYMFLTPMLWAVLAGTVLFPLKRRVTEVTQDWLLKLQETDTPLVIGLVVSPYKMVTHASECIYRNSMGYRGGAIVLTYILLKFLTYDRIFVDAIGMFGTTYGYVDSFLLKFTRPLVFNLLALYFIIYATWIYIQETVSKKLARALSVPIWLFILAKISTYFGPLRVLVFGATAVMLSILAAGIVRVDNESDIKTETESEEGGETEATTETAPAVAKPPAPTQQAGRVFSFSVYFRNFRHLCTLLWVVRHDSAIFLVACLFLFALLRRAGTALGIFQFISCAWNSFSDAVLPKVQRIVDITVASPLRQFFKVCLLQ